MAKSQFTNVVSRSVIVTLVFAIGVFVDAEIVTFNTMDVAVFSSAPPSAISVTTGQQIPGGYDNSAAGNEFNLSSLQFDIDGDFDPLGEDPTIYFDLQVRTATFVGGQTVLDGFQHDFTPGAPNGSYVITKGENSYLNLPFAQGDVIGDGVDEFERNSYDPPGPPNNNTFSVALDEGGIVTQFVAGVDNFVGFRLDEGYFGWIRVQYDGIAPGTLTFLDGAYDNTGAPIIAGSTSEGLDGDFNHDNKVDAADYTVWRDGLGSAYGPDDYTTWKTNFGRQLGSGAVSAMTVPEPLTGVMWLVASLVIPLLRRR
jgi:hypothetical protein